MTPRREFTVAQKRAALERAGHRCQDPQCGISDEWHELLDLLPQAGIDNFPYARGADESGRTQAELVALRDAILAKRFTYRRALSPLIKRFRLDGCALLEVDHERECADGGAPTLDNAIVRCVFCHLFKTLERGRVRRSAPKKQLPEQLDIVKTARVEGLRAVIQPLMTRPGSSRTDQPPVPVGMRARMAGPGEADSPAVPRERRHYSEAQWSRRLREKALAVQQDDGFFGA